jgi:hypothetical protein
VLAIALLACGGLGAAQALADDPPPITVSSATTTSPGPAPDPAPAPSPKPTPPKPQTKPAAKAPAVHRPATVQRQVPASVVHPQATTVAPAHASVTPRHVVTRQPVRKHPTKALVKAKPIPKPQAHVKAVVHRIVRKPAASKVTPHPVAAVPASTTPSPSGSSAVAWLLLFAVFGAVGLLLFVAGRSILGRVSRGSENTAAFEARPYSASTAATPEPPPPNAEGRAPTS